MLNWKTRWAVSGFLIWVDVLLDMLLRPFVSAMLALVRVLKFLNVKGDCSTRFEYGDATTVTRRRIASYPCWGPYFLFLNVGELLAHKHDVESAPTSWAVPKELDHSQSAFSVLFDMFLYPFMSAVIRVLELFSVDSDRRALSDYPI